MRKVNPENLNKPTLKVMLQVFLPFNDGSGGGEVVEAQDLCFLDESNTDIMKMVQGLVSDAKQISKHHYEIMKIKRKNAAAQNYENQPSLVDPVLKAAADRNRKAMAEGVDLPPAPVAIKKRGKK